MRLIEYIDIKLSQAKGNLSETLLYIREEILSLVGSMDDMRSDNERLAQEVRRLEEVLLKHTLLYPNNYKVQLEKLEAENTRLKAELEMYKAMGQKSYVAVNLMHPARNGNKWN
jgi:hypothetical protein